MAQTDSLAAAIRYGDEPARREALKRAEREGTGAIASLGDVMGGPDPAASRAAEEALRRIVMAAAKKPDSAGSAARELAKLVGKERPRKVRATALHLLGFSAGPDEVRQVGAQLLDPDVREEARMALERIPGRTAEQVLRNVEVPADYRPAIEQSLRHRRTSMREIGAKR